MNKDQEACEEELKMLWSKHDLSVLLQSLANVIGADTDIVESTNLYPEEVKEKRILVSALVRTSHYLLASREAY